MLALVGAFFAVRSATDGFDLESLFEEDGVTYAHIMDPRTGRPVQGVLSVAVLSEEATRGDVLDDVPDEVYHLFHDQYPGVTDIAGNLAHIRAFVERASALVLNPANMEGINKLGFTLNFTGNGLEN